MAQLSDFLREVCFTKDLDFHYRRDSKLKRPTEGQPAEAEILMARSFYNRFLPDFFAAAQRFRIASAMRLRPAADIMRRHFGAMAPVVVDGLLLLPGGRPRRLPPVIPPAEAPLTPSRAFIAASSRLRSSLSCTTISERFIHQY
jgi:hypothetical protein